MTSILDWKVTAAGLFAAALFAIHPVGHPAGARDLITAQAGAGSSGTGGGAPPGTAPLPPSPGSPTSPSHDTLNPPSSAPAGLPTQPGTMSPGTSTFGTPSTANPTQNPAQTSPQTSPLGPPSNNDRLLSCDSMSDPGARRLCAERVQTQ